MHLRVAQLGQRYLNASADLHGGVPLARNYLLVQPDCTACRWRWWLCGYTMILHTPCGHDDVITWNHFLHNWCVLMGLDENNGIEKIGLETPTPATYWILLEKHVNTSALIYGHFIKAYNWTPPSQTSRIGYLAYDIILVDAWVMQCARASAAMISTKYLILYTSSNIAFLV